MTTRNKTNFARTSARILAFVLALILSLPVVLSPLTTSTPTWAWILLFVADITLIVLLLFRLEPSLQGILMGLAGIFLVSIVAVITSQIFAATPPITDENGNPKPDPEIYLLVAKALGIPPGECMVVEDSVAGVRAGLAAGSLVLAVATPLTRRKLHESGLLDDHHIVDHPADLPGTISHLISHHNQSHESTRR